MPRELELVRQAGAALCPRQNCGLPLMRRPSSDVGPVENKNGRPRTRESEAPTTRDADHESA
jgi:hypothetical protein